MSGLLGPLPSPSDSSVVRTTCMSTRSLPGNASCGITLDATRASRAAIKGLYEEAPPGPPLTNGALEVGPSSLIGFQWAVAAPGLKSTCLKVARSDNPEVPWYEMASTTPTLEASEWQDGRSKQSAASSDADTNTRLQDRTCPPKIASSSRAGSRAPESEAGGAQAHKGLSAFARVEHEGRGRLGDEGHAGHSPRPRLNRLELGGEAQAARGAHLERGAEGVASGQPFSICL